MELNSLLVAAVLLSLLNVVTPLDIDSGDGGYQNLVVSISKDVPYDQSITEDIKSLFESSSEFLHRATNGRVHFKHVIIDVPSTWPIARGTYQGMHSGGYDVRVGLPVPPYGDRPFTKQVGSCGAPGEFIYLTPGFLAEAGVTNPQRHENAAYTFVHEWAHFRYGVFDEYGCQGDDRFPLTYCRNSQVKLNSCSARVRFTATLHNGSSCPINKDCQFSDDCKIDVFQPNDTLVESSIMFMPYLANVSQFCIAGTEVRGHNPYAPNKQNYMCKGKSTWEVISENKDFDRLPQPDMTKDVSVRFEERFRGLSQRVVLVLDVSPSMRGRRLDYLKEATSRYIREIPDGSQRLAIVTFTNKASINHNIAMLNATTRPGFLNGVKRLNVMGATCIGCGLQLALQVLNATNEGTAGAIVVLMSDGDENRPPYVDEVLELVVNSRIQVTTLALGSTASNSLEELALATGGRSYALADLRGGVALDMQWAFVESTTAQIDSGLRPVLVMRTETNNSRAADIPFMLDTTVGNNTVVYMEHDASTSISAWLLDPRKNRCHACYNKTTRTIMSVSIRGQAMAGNWTLHVESTTSSSLSVNIQVKSYARNASDEPIRLLCKVGQVLVEKPDQAKIYAEVTKGSKVVLDAQVFAEVIGPIHKSKLRLRDDGHDPDAHRNDGTYSGYFTGFSGAGRYTALCHVSSQSTTRLSYPACVSGSSVTRNVRSAPYGPGPLPLSEYPYSDFVFTENDIQETSAASLPVEKVGPLQRSATGGAFRVTTNLIEKDVPPGDIRDLSVTEVRRGANDTLLAQFTWTWPGAHLTGGKASAVVIRVSNDSDTLMSDFENQTKITEDDVVEGNLNPLPSGSKHNVTVSLPASLVLPLANVSSDWTAYLAARVTNSDGLQSEMSNIARVLAVTVPYTTTQTGVVPPSQGTVRSLWMWTMVAGVALFIVIIVVAVVLTYVRKPRRKSYDCN